jgi:hypothetical protein
MITRFQGKPLSNLEIARQVLSGKVPAPETTEQILARESERLGIKLEVVKKADK